MHNELRSLLVAELVFGTLGAAASPARADEWTRKYTVSGKPEVRVETNDGHVRVEAWDRPEIEARVETIGWQIADNEVRVTARQSGDRIELEVREPRHWNWNWGGARHSIKIALKIPREAALQVNTHDGNIELSGVKGEMRLSTGDGKIEATALDGRLIASTRDGHMRVEGRFDLLELKTGDGSIEARALTGSKLLAGRNISTIRGKINGGGPLCAPATAPSVWSGCSHPRVAPGGHLYVAGDTSAESPISQPVPAQALTLPALVARRVPYEAASEVDDAASCDARRAGGAGVLMRSKHARRFLRPPPAVALIPDAVRRIG